jgi:hypothetical protein
LRVLVAVVCAVCAVAGLAGPARAAPGGDATVEETTFYVDANARGEGVARCPAGSRVLGGGVGTAAATVGSVVGASGPLDETGLTANTGDGDIARSWYANVYNGAEARFYKVFALCSASSDATVEETTLTPPVGGGVGEVAEVARCPAGRRVVGGGVGTTTASVDIKSSVRVSGPLDETGLTANTVDGDTARSWYANVYNGARTYKVFALCSASSDATVEETTLPPPVGGVEGEVAEVARCPAGRRVLGGGVGTTAATVDSYVRVSGPLDETGTTAGTGRGDIARSWYANVFNYVAARTYKVFALCAADDVPPGPAPALPGPAPALPGPAPALPGPGPGGGGGGPDTTKPVLGALLMSSSVFQAAGSGPAFIARVGTKVSFTLSEPGSVKFTVQRKTRGRRVAGRCRPQTTANRTKPACTRWVNVRGSFTVAAKKGTNRFKFRGRIGGKKLKPASYRLNGRATDKSGNKSALKRKSFRIVK